MKRLTQKDDQGNWNLKGVTWERLHVGQIITQEVSNKLYGVLWKLMEYEETGLDPGEIIDLKDFEDSNTEKYLAEKMKHKWIPVAERLPDPGEKVLVQIEHNYCNNDGWWAIRESCYVIDHWYGIGNLCRVAAWMPRPERYRPED